MSVAALDDPVLKRFRALLDAAYGDRLERVVLYGSRARGDAGPDSDYDIAVFLRDMPDRGKEMKRLADLSMEILDDTFKVVHAMPLRAGAYNDPVSPLMHEIRREGRNL
jgi:predicted nucleotidyltransferase